MLLRVTVALWAFFHPKQVLKSSELEWLFQEMRLILTAAKSDVQNPQLTREERTVSAAKSKEMLQILDKLLS